MRLEPKPAPSLAVTLSFPLAAIVTTLVLTSILVLTAGASPLSVFYLVAKGAAGSQFALMETLTRATPLIFTGLAIAVAFRARLWNIGAEAQLYMGGIVTVALGTGALPLPSFILIPVLMILQRGVVEREEDYLERQFGEAYRKYKARVPRWL